MGHACGSTVTRDDVRGAENCIRHAGGSTVIKDVVVGLENHMGDTEGQIDVQDGLVGPENHMGEAEDQVQDQNDVGGPRGGRRLNRRPLWQWNRIFPGGAYSPRRINFTGGERILKQMPGQ